MGAKLRLTVTVMTVAGLLSVPGPHAGAQEGPSARDVAALKEGLRTLPSSGGLGGSGLSGAAVSTTSAPLSGGGHHGGANVQVSDDQDPAATLRSGASELTLASTSDGRRL